MIDPLTVLDLPAAVAAQARSLAALGRKEVAWSRGAVLEILPHLRSKSVAVLGGEVVRFTEGRIHQTSDNWHTEPVHGEAFADYAQRSIENTERYIMGYSEPGPGCCYVLLLADRLT